MDNDFRKKIKNYLKVKRQFDLEMKQLEKLLGHKFNFDEHSFGLDSKNRGYATICSSTTKDDLMSKVMATRYLLAELEDAIMFDERTLNYVTENSMESVVNFIEDNEYLEAAKKVFEIYKTEYTKNETEYNWYYNQRKKNPKFLKLARDSRKLADDDFERMNEIMQQYGITFSDILERKENDNVVLNESLMDNIKTCIDLSKKEFFGSEDFKQMAKISRGLKADTFASKNIAKRIQEAAMLGSRKQASQEVETVENTIQM